MKVAPERAGAKDAAALTAESMRRLEGHAQAMDALERFRAADATLCTWHQCSTQWMEISSQQGWTKRMTC